MFAYFYNPITIILLLRMVSVRTYIDEGPSVGHKVQQTAIVHVVNTVG